MGIVGEQLRQLCYQCSQSKALNQIIKILLQVHVNIHGCLMLCSSKNKSFGCFWRNFATSRPWKVEGNPSPSMYLVGRKPEWLIWTHWSLGQSKVKFAYLHGGSSNWKFNRGRDFHSKQSPEGLFWFWKFVNMLILLMVQKSQGQPPFGCIYKTS